MPDINMQRNLVNLTKGAIASAYVAATAGGTGDATAVTGSTIDRNSHGQALNAVFTIAYEAVLAQDKTLSIGSVGFQHSDDGSSWATYTPPEGAPTSPGVVATGQSGGSTERGVARIGANLQAAKRYVRMNWTPDLSATATDTLKAMTTATLAGFSSLPPA